MKSYEFNVMTITPSSEKPIYRAMQAREPKIQTDRGMEICNEVIVYEQDYDPLLAIAKLCERLYLEKGE